MNTSDTISSCDPKLHNGQRVVADFTVWGAEPTGERRSTKVESAYGARSFACCVDHLEYAILDVMTADTSHAIVRREVRS